MKYFMSFFLFFLLLFSVSGQSVRASVESSEVYLGQPFEFRIIIEGTTSAEVPELEDIDGINKQYKGASTSMVSSFGNGSSSSSKTITYSWTFTPLRKGTLLIPSFSIDVDGEIYKTASGTILVKDPENIEGFYLFLETDKKSFWKGEPVELTIKWLFASSVSNPVFNLPFIESGLFTIESQNPQQGNDVYKLNIDGLEVLAMQSAQIYKGDQYSTLSFSFKLIPRESGTFSIGPITLAFDSAERSSGFRTSYKSLVIPSNSIDLNIKELPAEARAIGETLLLSNGPLSIQTEATPLKVHIGDPLTYTLQVLGAVTPENVELPSLNIITEMTDNFSIPDRRSPGKVDGESVSFAQTIRVNNRHIDGIPQWDLPYFDIQTGSLKRVNIPAVPIEVLETNIVTSADLESTGYTVSETNDGKELISNEDGLLFNFESELLLQKGNGGQNPILKNPKIILLFFLPIIIYLSLLVYKKRGMIQKITRSLMKDNSDFSTIYAKILKENKTDINSVSKEIKNYLRHYCQMRESYFPPDKIFQCLIDLHIDYEVSNAVRELLFSFEENEYSKEKKSLDGMTVLNEFYSLTREFT